MEKDLKIIFHIESIEDDTYIPSCIIFYTKKKTLYNLKTLVPASTLKENNCYTVYSFLEKNIGYMISLLNDNDEKTSSEFVEEVFKNKDSSLKSIKSKLFTILRKQKINNLLS